MPTRRRSTLRIRTTIPRATGPIRPGIRSRSGRSRRSIRRSTLPALSGIPELAGMELLRKGSRLSIQPVTDGQWKTILALAKTKKKR